MNKWKYYNQGMFSVEETHSGRSPPSTRKSQHIHQYIRDKRKSPFVTFETRYVRWRK